jgi:hypothetical protein
MEHDRFQPPVRSTTPHLSRTVEIDEVNELNHSLAGLDELRLNPAGGSVIGGRPPFFRETFSNDSITSDK